jgi:hypothetical protein
MPAWPRASTFKVIGSRELNGFGQPRALLIRNVRSLKLWHSKQDSAKR